MSPYCSGLGFWFIPFGGSPPSAYLLTTSHVISCLFHTVSVLFASSFHTYRFRYITSPLFFYTVFIFFLLMWLSVSPRLVSLACHFPISSLCIYSSALSLVSYQAFCFPASVSACICVSPSVVVSAFGLQLFVVRLDYSLVNFTICALQCFLLIIVSKFDQVYKLFAWPKHLVSALRSSSWKLQSQRQQ